MPSIHSAAPGKCILFGEHAVVYGYPAISCAIDVYSRCKIDQSNHSGIEIKFGNQGNFHYENPESMIIQIPSLFKQFAIGIDILEKTYEIDIDSLKIDLDSDLWLGAGLGSSASTAVAFISALSAWYKLNLNKDEINRFAFELEKQVHGTPSGIDNSTSTYGGVLQYEKGKVTFLETSKKKFHLLITYSGVAHNTGNAVEGIKKLKHNQPDFVDNLFYSIGHLTHESIHHIKKNDMKKLGNLMNKNQQILSKLLLSTKEIDEITHIASSLGAYGSKLTGAGVGGCVITIGEKSQLEIIEKKLTSHGYPSTITSIDFDGARIIKEAFSK